MFDQESLKQIKAALKDNQQTIAVAESVTAGLLQAALASAEEATEVFQGGLTAYNVGQKCRHLSVNPIHALSCNCVSARMAGDMAISVARLFTSDWGIGITGYATPVPESGNEVYAYVSIACGGQERCMLRLDAGERKGLDAQLFYVNSILAALHGALRQEPPGKGQAK